MARKTRKAFLGLPLIELMILRLVHEGLGSKEIAERISVPPRSFSRADVDWHIKAAMEILHTTTRREAAALLARAEMKPTFHGEHTSSAWTGRYTPKQQAKLVLSVAPLALNALDELVSSVEELRLNDPEALDALAALKELHAALGELLILAERGRALKKAFSRFEASKARAAVAISNTAQVMIVAPTVAIGASYMLSLLSGMPVSDSMLTALCATMIGKDALLTLAKR